jgi:hypothetical protein
MQKLDQISPREFMNFLREFLPNFVGNTLDYNKVIVTEKPDGSAIRVAICNGDLLFESSYSGLVTYDQVPFKNEAKWIYENWKHVFQLVAKTVGFDFKVIGELIWCKDRTDNGTVTPVGTTYLTKEFGEFGSIIIINIEKIVGDELVELTTDEYNTIVSLLKKNNTDDFTWFCKQEDLKFNQPFQLDINIPALIEMLKTPEFNKPRFTAKIDKVILEKIEAVRNELLDKAEQAIVSHGGRFSPADEIIEGVVLTNVQTRSEYGIFSKNYKKKKETYFRFIHAVEDAYTDFLFNVFGNKVISVIRKKYDINNEQQYKIRFELNWSLFIKFFNQTFNEFITSNLPKSTKLVQMKMFEDKKEKFEKINNFEDFKTWMNI